MLHQKVGRAFYFLHDLIWVVVDIEIGIYNILFREIAGLSKVFIFAINSWFAIVDYPYSD